MSTVTEYRLSWEMPDSFEVDASTGSEMTGNVVSAVADVLNRAADLIERDGWCQWSIGTVDGPKCPAGALKVALDTPLDLWTAEWDGLMDELAEAIGLDPSDDVGCVADWNDDPDRTQAEVVAALRAAAERAA